MALDDGLNVEYKGKGGVENDDSKFLSQLYLQLRTLADISPYGGIINSLLVLEAERCSALLFQPGRIVQ